MASAEQIRRAMEAEAPPDDVEYRAPPVVDVADRAAAPVGVAPLADGGRRERAGHRGLGGGATASRHGRRRRRVALDRGLGLPAVEGDLLLPNYIASNPAHATAVRGLHRACLLARERPKNLTEGSCGVVRPLHAFTKARAGRQQKAVMDIDQFEWFFALQDAARGAPGHRGAHDVQVIFKMLFDDQGVDVALRRRAPLMPPIEEPWPGGLDLRDVAEASRNYDAVRPGGAGSLVADLKRLCARFNGAAPAAAIIVGRSAPAPAARRRRPRAATIV